MSWVTDAIGLGAVLAAAAGSGISRTCRDECVADMHAYALWVVCLVVVRAFNGCSSSGASPAILVALAWLCVLEIVEDDIGLPVLPCRSVHEFRELCRAFPRETHTDNLPVRALTAPTNS